MAYTITSESYGPRKPFITATATSTDDLAALGTDFAEGSTCVISSTTYKLDKVKGWIDPSQGGGGSGGGGVLVVHVEDDQENPDRMVADHTVKEVYDTISAGGAAVCVNSALGAWLLYAYDLGEGEYEVIGFACGASNSNGTISRILGDSSSEGDIWTYADYSFSVTPGYGS